MISVVMPTRLIDEQGNCCWYISDMTDSEFQKEVQSESRSLTLFPLSRKRPASPGPANRIGAQVSCVKCGSWLGSVDDIRVFNDLYLVLDRTACERVIPFSSTDFMKKPPAG